MKTSGSSLSALLVGCITIAACSQTTELSRFQYTPTVNSLSDRGATPRSYRVLHSFGADHDGNFPLAGLIDGSDAFYGTTSGGGLYRKGTVFTVTTGGTEKILRSFGKGIKGRYPYAGVIDVKGTLYGTTPFGGEFGDGTAFSMTTDGSEKVLHSFGRGSDGKYPGANLINVGGTLYGTTDDGGTNPCNPSEGCGTIFSITPGGKEKVLHSFGKGADGRFPYAGLIDVRGTLYGTTAYGGKYGTGKYGTVFSITRSGKEKVLHSFGEGRDGALPEADLVNVNGTLYGTTWYGGTQNSGTIFSITRNGHEKVLHSFTGTDGAEPYGGLIDVGGTLYGTTIGGGKYCVSGNACGTVFSITTGGADRVLHDFAKGTDGVGPLGDLIYNNGSLFGVTEAGGVYANQHEIGGTVFSLTP
jgi:uncharacterized repeat protein (TIGR03803 family)